MYPNKSIAGAAMQGVSLGAQAQASTSDRLTVLEEHVNQITGATSDLDVLADRLHSVADRVFGVRPPSNVAGDKIPVQECSIGRLAQAMQYNEFVRTKLRDAVARLEAL